MRWWIWAAIAIVLFTGFRAVQRTQAAEPAFTQTELERAARSMSQVLPQVSPGGTTRTFKVTVQPGRVFQYHNTVIGQARAQINAPGLMAQVMPVVRRQACTNASLAPMFRAGVIVGYVYWSEDGGYIGEVRIAPSDCRGY